VNILRILKISTFCFLLLLTCKTQAAFLTWDGGAGNTWSTTTASWSGSNWINNFSAPNSSIFGLGGVGNINIVAPVQVQDIYVNADGYSFSGGNLSLLNFPTIFADSNLLVNSNIYVGSFTEGNTLNKDGLGNLTTTGDIRSAYGNGGGGPESCNFNVQSGQLTIVGTNYCNWTTNTISPGAVLQVGNGSTLGSVSAGVSLINNGSFVYYKSSTSSSLNYGQMTGSGTVDVKGGTLILSGTNTYSGTTTIDVGATLQIGSYGYSGTLGVSNSLINNGAFSYANTDTTSLSTNISGLGNLSVLAGTLKLRGNNTYLGTTTVNSNAALIASSSNALNGTSKFMLDGYLDLSGYSGGNFSAGSISGSSSGAIVTNTSTGTIGLIIGGNNENTSYSGMISDGNGKMTLTKIGSGTFSVSGNQVGSYTGTTTVSAGKLILAGSTNSVFANIDSGAVLQFGNNNASGALVFPSIINNGLLSYNRTDDNILSGMISGTGTLQVVTGKIYITATSSYTGTTTIFSSSTLQIGDGYSSAGTLGSNLAPIINNGSLICDRGSSVVETWNNYITGTGTLAVNGGVLNLTNTSNDYSGTTTVYVGKLMFTSGALSSGPLVMSVGSTLVWNDGNNDDVSPRLQPLSAGSSANNVTFDVGNNDVVFSSGISGIGGVAKAGTSSLTILATSTYNGGTRITGGTLRAGGTNVFGQSTSTDSYMYITGTTKGSLDLNGYSVSTNGLAGSSGGIIFNGATSTSATITVGNSISGFAAARQLYQGIIQDGAGVVSVIKVGTSTQVFSGNSTYSGSTFVNAGELTIGTSSTSFGLLGTGNVNITSGAVLSLFNGQTQNLGSLSGSGKLAIRTGTTNFVNSPNAISTFVVGKFASVNSGGNNIVVDSLFNQAGNCFLLMVHR
jgi:autotransporter-associated beta strand protein